MKMILRLLSHSVENRAVVVLAGMVKGGGGGWLWLRVSWKELGEEELLALVLACGWLTWSDRRGCSALLSSTSMVYPVRAPFDLWPCQPTSRGTRTCRAPPVALAAE